jgi:hypothetical protein
VTDQGSVSIALDADGIGTPAADRDDRAFLRDSVGGADWRIAAAGGGDWTTAVVSWQVRTSSVWFTCRMVAEHGTLPLERQGSIYFPPSDKILRSAKLMG